MDQARKVCILIIHGIGQQGRYDTLDLFTRNLVKSLQDKLQHPLRLAHHHLRVGEEADDYVSLGYDHHGPTQVDIHEYYWAHDMERIVSFRETIEWLIQASDGAQKFYDENEQFAAQFEPFENGRFKKRWYLKHIGWVLRLFYTLGLVSSRFMPGFLDPLFRLFMGKATQLVVDYLGDVAIYTSSDVKSKFYQVRQLVLGGAQKKIKLLLERDYEKVIVVGHSLGSVIAYDALNQLNLQMNEDAELAQHKSKLSELITLGSPLDKVAFFFREHIPDEEYVKKLIIAHINGFRRKDVLIPSTAFEPPSPLDPELSSSVRSFLRHMRWTNYWDERDPISGRLDFYNGVLNVKVDNERRWGYAHIGYWENMQIYREALERTLAPQCQVPEEQTGQEPFEPDDCYLIGDFTP
ncbi:MAG TPA: hypothetical protein VFV52_02160 [Bacilli bacterium]|nr:hypothetical protein [Bacilli bacterium]